MIERQLKWLKFRSTSENKLGMLYRAIEEDWSMPVSLKVKEKQMKLRAKEKEQTERDRQREAKLKLMKEKRSERQKRLLKEWESASLEDRDRWIHEAVKRESSRMIAEILKRESVTVSKPHRQVLDVMALERNLPLVSQVDQKT